MILHLAAGANVDRSIERPLDFVMDNTVASVNLMEFARKNHPDLDRWKQFSNPYIISEIDSSELSTPGLCTCPPRRCSDQRPMASPTRSTTDTTPATPTLRPRWDPSLDVNPKTETPMI